MNPIEKIIDEHDVIERELIELEAVMGDENMNFPNLLHTLKSLTKIWNNHEEKEEKLFGILAKEEVKMPVFKMRFGHKRLKGHREAILHAISSGSEELVKEAVRTDGEFIIRELKQHIDDEEGILRMIPLTMFSEEEVARMQEIVK